MTSKDNLEFILKEFTRHLSKLETELILDKAEPIVKDLELLEILKKLVLGVGTEEDLAVARKHFEMEIKQAIEELHEGCTIIQLDLEE